MTTQDWLKREFLDALRTSIQRQAGRDAPFRMRLAELHNTTGILGDFHDGRTVPAGSSRLQGGKDVGLPEPGMYVSVWSVLPVQDPDREYPGIFIGYGLIDGVEDGGESTNISIRPLKESDSFYPFMAGTVRRYIESSGYPVGAAPKTCMGYMVPNPPPYAGVVCGKPITRITEHYGKMSCDSCYPHVKREDDAHLEAEKEMHADYCNPGQRDVD